MVASFFLISTIVSPIWGEIFQPILQINDAIKVNPLTPVGETHFVVECVSFSIFLGKLSWPLHSYIVQLKLETLLEIGQQF